MSEHACCDGCGNRSEDCRCADACGAPAALAAPVNRPGLAELDVRIGTYGEFFNAALRALSAPDAPQLQALGTRATSDPAVAWLDAWSIVADVLTFYRERITNEGYLRTATEDFSLRELAREIGYKPRPGIAASVRLAYLLDATAAPVTIPAGAKAQTVPQPGEQMQTFETSEPLDAQAQWSQMSPRSTRIPGIDRKSALLRSTLRLNDPTLAVRPGERVLFVFGHSYGEQVVREVASAKVDVRNGFVELSLKPRLGLNDDRADTLLARVDVDVKPASKKQAAAQAIAAYMLGASAQDVKDAAHVDSAVEKTFDAIDGSDITLTGGIQAQTIDAVLGVLAAQPTAQLRSPQQLPRAAADGLDASGVKRASLLASLAPRLGQNLYATWSKLPAVASDLSTAPHVFLLRLTAGAYGASAPQVPLVQDGRPDFSQMRNPPLASLDTRYAFLDVLADGVAPGSYALVESPMQPTDKGADADLSTRTVRFAYVRSSQPASRGDYGISGKVTRLDLVDPATNAALDWLPKSGREVHADLGFLRNTTYAVQSQAVQVAPEPIDGEVSGSTVFLDRLYDGLESGRWIIVAGERTDIVVDNAPVTGIQDGELAMIADVTQGADPTSPGDSPRTVLTLARPLAYAYKLVGTIVYGNIVHATHGETVSEVLGSGDATVPFARFALRRAPLTFVAAVSTSGAQGTQLLRVNATKLGEVESLLDADSTDRVYELATDGNGAATVIGGDGVHGARIPSGQENVKATYRVGIGSVGNVERNQITLLTSRPLGVNAVLNPLRASGGADRDGPETIRANAPLAALALSPLSRLVSVSDYGYFARRFAGIGDARATRLADGRYQCVHVTLAGVDDIPLSLDDDLVTSLAAAYEAYGDPSLPVVVAIRELVALFVQAKVVLRADADEQAIEPEIRRRVLETFSFGRRQLAQSAYLSEVLAAIQQSPGVDWTDVEVLGGISELQMRDPVALAAAVADLQKQASGAPASTVVYASPAMRADDAPAQRLALLGKSAPRLLPAQLAILVPDVTDTLVLNFA